MLIVAIFRALFLANVVALVASGAGRGRPQLRVPDTA